MTPATLPRLLTAAEVADQTGVPVSTIYELTRRGELPAVRIGPRNLRYAEPAVRAWAERGGARAEP
jgi:excisionase family DNA binding protein